MIWVIKPSAGTLAKPRRLAAHYTCLRPCRNKLLRAAPG